MTNRLWLWLFHKATRRLARAHKSCANRNEFQFGYLSERNGPMRVDVIVRRRNESEAYSREELLSMLWTARKYERTNYVGRVGDPWCIPEPSDGQLAKFRSEWR